MNENRWQTNHQIPSVLLNYLYHQGTPRLYIESPGEPAYRSFLLVDNQHLHLPYIHSLSFIWEAGCGGISDEIKRLILSNPFLHTLRLKPSRQQPFVLTQGETLPPIKILHFTNFVSDHNQAEIWVQCLQSHRLKHLTLDCDFYSLQFLTHLSGKAPNLTSFEIRNQEPLAVDSNCNRIQWFLRGIHSLQSFVAYNLPTTIFSIAASIHGEHLRKIGIRTNKWIGARGGALMSFQELRDLALTLPKVERLGIDLKFEGRLPVCYKI